MQQPGMQLERSDCLRTSTRREDSSSVDDALLPPDHLFVFCLLSLAHRYLHVLTDYKWLPMYFSQEFLLAG